MGRRNFLNLVPETTLNGGVNATTQAWVVLDGTGYPAVPFGARSENEVVEVTAKSGTNDVNWTVTRGFDGTTGAIHATGVTVTDAFIAADANSYLTTDSVTFAVVGALADATVGTFRWYAPYDLTIIDAVATVGVAPTSTAAVFDVNKGGTTIFTTQTNRPSIAASGYVDVSGTPEVTAMTKDTDYLTVDVDTASAAEDATVTVRFVRA